MGLLRIEGFRVRGLKFKDYTKANVTNIQIHAFKCRATEPMNLSSVFLEEGSPCVCQCQLRHLSTPNLEHPPLNPKPYPLILGIQVYK